MGSDFGNKDENINNFTGHIYFLPEYTNKLPDFSKLTSVGQIYTDCLNISDQDFKLGFPGVTNRFEYFAIDYKGKFYLKDSSIYKFLLASDDGSKLYIDGNLVIDNDYGHSIFSKTNFIKLNKGVHEIEVQYFQGPRDRVALQLLYKKSDEKTFQLFNLTNFYPISVNETDSQIDVSIGDQILFDFNSFELCDASKNVLSEIKRILIDKTKLKSIIIEGHTDDIGSETYNMGLSLKRANSVKLFLISIGISPQLLFTKGCGKSKPKVPNIDDESRKMNRRIEITILKEN